MTYSINVRARTRDDCKQALQHALQTQMTGQPGHQHDRPHVQRFLDAMIDNMPETAFDEIVVDAYGYVSIAGDGSLRMMLINAKVYAAPAGSVTVVAAVIPPGMTMPPSGTF